MSETISNPDHEDEEDGKDEKQDIKLSEQWFEQLPDSVANMWEIPQIYEFLCLAKDTLHINHLSMYETERMLLIPKASKQLANIMTSLLSPHLPISRFKEIPPMPYEFWTSYLLTHKVPNWFKIYESKDKDSVRVLDAIGIEPEFWKLFPDISCIEQHNFEDFEFKQRVWLLKTICDTLMHTRKTLQEEVANRYLEGQSEKILGRDRYGARYIYFPIFLDGDLRVYKHFMNNRIFLNPMPVSAKFKLQAKGAKGKKLERKRSKNNRWKNGHLPVKSKRRIKLKKLKISIKSNEMEGNLQDTSSSIESEWNKDDLNKDLMGAESKEAIMDIIGVKPCVIEENDNHPPLDEISNSSKTDDEKMNEIMSSNNGIVIKNNSEVSKSDDEKLIETKTGICSVDNDAVYNKNDDHFHDKKPEVDRNDKNNDDTIDDNINVNDNEKKVTTVKENEERKNVIQMKVEENITATFDNEKIDTEISDNDAIKNGKVVDTNIGNNNELNKMDDENEDEEEESLFSFIENERISRRSRLTDNKKNSENFNNILTDLEVSKFQLVADSIESLHDLVENFSAQTEVKCNEPVRCEFLLLNRLKALIQSLEAKESYLQESTSHAKQNLRNEWAAFQDGSIKNEAPPTDNNLRPVAWTLSSQGCPFLSYTDVTPDHEEEIGKPQTRCKKEEGDKNDTKEEQETRRVLRARGVSSYIEQFSSDDDSNSSHPEDWVGFETVDPATGVHTSPYLPQLVKVRSIGGESDATDSDKDWILPSSRKRKKRSSSNKRLRPNQNKIQIVKVDGNTGKVMNDDTENIITNDIEATVNDNTEQSEECDNSPLNRIKIESVHSVLDIKDEVPMIDNQPTNIENVTGSVQQNYVLLNTGNGPVNYVVMKQENTLVTPPSPVISVLPQVPVQTGYYVQNSQGYLVSNPQINNAPSSYHEQQPVVPRMIMQRNNRAYLGPPSYVHYQQYNMMPRGSNLYPGPVSKPLVTSAVQSPRVLPRIVQNRPIVLPPRPRHPEGAVIRSTAVPLRGNIRPQMVAKGIRMTIPPRHPNAIRNIRPMRPQLSNLTMNVNANQQKVKSTSLIVLSDDDDEIEMIIPEKSNAGGGKTVNTPTVKTIVNRKQLTTNSATNPLPDRGGLSPQIIERMNQGGISITPVKRKSPEKQQPISATQLVVVVNETGSHYALSLPNGSKLILTPEQVAQIRASNGGKLIL